MSKEINWSPAPDWAKWWAVDSNGVGFFYDIKPKIDGNYSWWNNKGRSYRDDNSKTYNLTGIDWRNSLTRRPEEQTANPICCGVLEQMEINWMVTEDGTKCMPFLKSNSDKNLWRVVHCPSCGQYVRDSVIIASAQMEEQ